MTAERALPLGDPLVSATLTLRTALRRAPSGIAVLRAPVERALAYLEVAVRARAAAQYHDLIARRDGPPGDGTAAAELFPSSPGVPSAAAVPLAVRPFPCGALRPLLIARQLLHLTGCPHRSCRRQARVYLRLAAALRPAGLGIAAGISPAKEERHP